MSSSSAPLLASLDWTLPPGYVYVFRGATFVLVRWAGWALLAYGVILVAGHWLFPPQTDGEGDAGQQGARFGRVSYRGRIVRWLLIVCMSCSSEELGKRAEKASVDPADYTLTLQQAQKAIEAHSGPGCLRMFPYVACRGCVAKYRLDPLEVGDAVGPCERSTFIAGSEITTANAPQGKSFTWTCDGGALGGTWTNGAIESTGALVCRD